MDSVINLYVFISERNLIIWIINLSIFLSDFHIKHFQINCKFFLHLQVSYNYSIFDQADIMEALLKKQNVGAVHILAHDYGYTVAQELIAR